MANTIIIKTKSDESFKYTGETARYINQRIKVSDGLIFFADKVILSVDEFKSYQAIESNENNV